MHSNGPCFPCAQVSNGEEESDDEEDVMGLQGLSSEVRCSASPRSGAAPCMLTGMLCVHSLCTQDCAIVIRPMLLQCYHTKEEVLGFKATDTEQRS